MRYFFTRSIPPFQKVLLVESGSRHLLESLIPGIYATYGDEMQLDLVTCYAGVPDGFRGEVFRVTDYAAPGRRKLLFQELAAREYNVMGIICSGEPIMPKWKWALTAKLPVKVFVLNENGDYFWLHWSDWRVMRHFVLYRAGLSGADAVGTLARLLLFPFTILYLLLYTAVVHLKRKVRT